MSSFRPLPCASLSWRATHCRMLSLKTKINPGNSTATGLQSRRCTRVFFQAFAMCKSLLEGYPAQNFVILTLNTILLQGLRWTHVCFQAFAVCESLLEGYPAQNFVILTLNTMTQLAVHSLVNMSSHASRLLAILNTDLRHGVHLTCLHNLRLLARSGPHLWHSSNVEVQLTSQ